LLLAGASVGVVAVIAVVIALALSGGGRPSLEKVEQVMKAAGCSFTTAPASAANDHVGSLTARITYNTFPPTSGRHYGQTARWGNYTQPAEPRQVVHNEEHGGLIIWYGEDITAAERENINEFYDSSPNGVLVTPFSDSQPGLIYPKGHESIRGKIALTVWNADVDRGIVTMCPKVDFDAFKTFRSAFRYRGPERFSRDAMQPGSN
jgi:hypothetical protein